jgi:imidazolonepropionase-like amidohydrolase
MTVNSDNQQGGGQHDRAQSRWSAGKKMDAVLRLLRAVTSVAADACRVGDRKGRIAPGYDADLLAVDGDPLTDANAVREVVAVFRAGHRVR